MTRFFRHMEDAYRRYQDFGLVVALALALFFVGMVVRQLVLGACWKAATTVLFCVCLMALLIPLIACVRVDAPAPWMERRTTKERVLAGAVVLFVIAVVGVIFIAL